MKDSAENMRRLESTRRLESAFEAAAIGMIIKDAGGRPLRSNPAFRQMLGYEEDELRGMLRRDFTHPEDVEEDDELYEELLRGEREGFQIEKRYVKKGGGIMWGRLSVSRIEGAEGEPSLAMGVVEDISELKRAEAALGTSERRFRTVVEQSPLSIHVFASDGSSIRANDSWNQLWYLDEGEEPEGASVFEDEQLRVAGLLPYVNDGVAGIGRKIPPLLFDPVRAGRKGEPRWLEGVIYPLKDSSGETTEVTLMLEDVTERRALEDRLTHQALHDPMTNLPNRVLFLDRLGQAFARLQRRSEQEAEQHPGWHPGQNVALDAEREDVSHRGPHRKDIAVLFLDLDNLKNVNDSLGHDAGDELLVEVSRRLRNRLRPADTLARLAGDEFVVLLEEVGEEEASRAAERIAQGINTPFTVANQEVFVSISIGIALGGSVTSATGQPAGSEAELLLRYADLAMYKAKTRGKARYVLYEERMGQEASERMKLERDLRHALRRQEIEVHYQPKISLESSHAVGVEALARWRHPERGLVLPAEFIGLAEQTGLIVDLGYQVLRTALRQAREWRERQRAKGGEKFPAGGVGEPVRPPVPRAGSRKPDLRHTRRDGCQAGRPGPRDNREHPRRRRQPLCIVARRPQTPRGKARRRRLRHRLFLVKLPDAPARRLPQDRPLLRLRTRFRHRRRRGGQHQRLRQKRCRERDGNLRGDRPRAGHGDEGSRRGCRNGRTAFLPERDGL